MNGFDQMDALGKENKPFLFLINYAKTDIRVYPLSALKNNSEILYNFRGHSNHHTDDTLNEPIEFSSKSISYEAYLDQFNRVKQELQMGNTYLLNLTAPSELECSHGLADIYHNTNARFKALVNNQFVFFSPERFVEIEQNTLKTYPMKGTIDANLPNAEQRILKDEKETAEHNTIVDLLRNDISQVGTNTRVERYRFVDKITTNQGDLLQVSSEICADLESNWKNRIGSIMNQLTPAGSICGAPKQKTCEIIESIENYDRGFYTGVCGLFTGDNLYSGVMIRFIEKTQSGLVFKSGGGIHNLSKAKDEYNEMIQKVYLPS